MNPLSTKINCLLLFISSIIISCNDDEIVYPEGGYEYPKHIENKDTTFWCYPLKDIKSTRDSFETAYSYDFFKIFDESNLGLKPKDEPTFRFIYGGDTASIITLTPKQIIIKRQIKGWNSPWHDTAKLTKVEQFDFNTLQRFYPLNDTSFKGYKRYYFDSLTKANPKLLDPNYYKLLRDKSANWGDEKFEYSLKKIPISERTFKRLINQINKSGYWQLPYENWCKNIPTHANLFILEANTTNKYNIVRSTSCSDDSTKYTNACQQLIKEAEMDKEINLIWSWPVNHTPIKARELELQDLKPEPKPKKKKAK